MVAVALLPPLVVVGLLAGSGEWSRAGTAAVLLVTYLITVNLAGVLTFLAQGVRPREYWEAERARRATAIAMVVWAVLLALLAAAIMWRG